MKLIVYRCYDNLEEEAMFQVETAEQAKAWLDKKPLPPWGFGDRPGYYFFEDVN